MNIYKCLNELTSYIEENLESKIDYNVLARFLGVNTYTMQRIFSLIAGLSLAEYIRKRRLSNAGFDLYKTHDKVMDIAIKYQYDNATSFSRAFESFHGIKPSQVNKLSTLKIFPRIIFDENIAITNELEYEIIELNELNLYGIGVTTNNNDIKIDAPKLFKSIEAKYYSKYGNINYGLIAYNNNMREECVSYYVAYDKPIKGFEQINIPASKWLKFSINSQDAKDIQEMSENFYLEFLPSCKYNLREIPELEYYHDGITDFLVPIY